MYFRAEALLRAGMRQKSARIVAVAMRDANFLQVTPEDQRHLGLIPSYNRATANYFRTRYRYSMRLEYTSQPCIYCGDEEPTTAKTFCDSCWNASHLTCANLINPPPGSVPSPVDQLWQCMYCTVLRAESSSAQAHGICARHREEREDYDTTVRVLEHALQVLKGHDGMAAAEQTTKLSSALRRMKEKRLEADKNVKEWRALHIERHAKLLQARAACEIRARMEPQRHGYPHPPRSPRDTVAPVPSLE